MHDGGIVALATSGDACVDDEVSVVVLPYRGPVEIPPQLRVAKEHLRLGTVTATAIPSIWTPTRGKVQCSCDRDRSSLPDSFLQLLGKTCSSLQTTGDGVCGIHGLYGQPSQSGLLFCPQARSIARELLGPTYADVCSRVGMTVELRQLAISL